MNESTILKGADPTTDPRRVVASSFLTFAGVPGYGAMNVVLAVNDIGEARHLLGLLDSSDTQPVSGPVDLRLPVISRNYGFNGVSWDRVRTAGNDVASPAAQMRGIVQTGAFLYGFNPDTGVWNRINSASGIDNADGVGEFDGRFRANAHQRVFNGAAWDRARSASAANLASLSGVGATLAAEPGNWAIQHQPAAGIQAAVTRGAVAGQRHVCRSITVSLAAVNAQGIIYFNLLDGATSLWTAAFVLLAGTSDRLSVAGLNIVGSIGAAMTLQSSIAPAVGNFATVALSGYTSG